MDNAQRNQSANDSVTETVLEFYNPDSRWMSPLKRQWSSKVSVQ